MDDRRAQLLRAAFLAGAVTDALALVPMLWPPTARLLWGFEATAFVAAPTVLVIWGLVATEVAAVVSGTLPAWRMAPTWVLQAALLGLFASAYHYPTIRRWAVA